MRFKVLAVFIVLPIFNFSPCFAQGEMKEDKIVGEFFDIPVSVENYYFAKRVILNFSANWRSNPRNEEELENLVWQELLFSFEVFRRGIEATDTEINKEVDKILKAEKVEFDWKEDTKAFKKWAEEKLQEPLDLFKNQIEHLVKLEKLRQQVLNSIEPEVTEEEAYQKFLDEYNSLGVELIQFDDSDLQEAQGFYSKLESQPQAWEKKKEEALKSFKDLKGPYALDFLINLWGFKREDAYRMIDMEKGNFYKPSPIYKGYAVFKIITTRKADPEEFDKRKDYYFDKIKMMKKYRGFKNWAKKLKEEANIKVFIK